MKTAAKMFVACIAVGLTNAAAAQDFLSYEGCTSRRLATKPQASRRKAVGHKSPGPEFQPV